MHKTLGPGAIGIRNLPLPEAIALARETGFDSVTFDLREAARLVDERGAEALRSLFVNAGVRPGPWSVPVAWRGEDAGEADLRRLPELATLARELGSTRATTGVMPGSDAHPYDENMAWHVERLGPVADVLAAEGCRLGIEFIGPKTFRAPFKHPFVYTLRGALDLAGAIGTGNVGVLLDAWHLYTSGGDVADLAAVAADDVVFVHVNDAPPGIPVAEQLDSVRALPLETGVIEIVPFLRALRDLGYDGPVMPEPFSQRLEELAARHPLAAAQEAGRAMDDLWRAAGLA